MAPTQLKPHCRDLWSCALSKASKGYLSHLLRANAAKTAPSWDTVCPVAKCWEGPWLVAEAACMPSASRRTRPRSHACLSVLQPPPRLSLAGQCWLPAGLGPAGLRSGPGTSVDCDACQVYSVAQSSFLNPAHSKFFFSQKGLL